MDWPNARNILQQGGQTGANMLCPTMLQDVALKCCERLARPLLEEVTSTTVSRLIVFTEVVATLLFQV